MKTIIKINGMMCMHCVAHVDRALRAVPGVTAVAVDLAGGCATVDYEAPAKLSDLEKAITNEGYEIVKE